ncbi:type III effector protein [Streptomyces sp. NBC_01198]|uniref:type III effector protein n=1 Tax=Streptomyces sp. NBC_01198 TaxID=2903769 RepID=UPI002E165FED|nr:type III effector protein [Streptomyces sp. NBC_01198]
MTADRSAPPGPPEGGGTAASFLAAAAALETIRAALQRAGAASPGDDPGPAEGPRQALASLLLLREVREQLAGWETGLIETARTAGASWADLAAPLGVASRQAAERRYLRLRPGPPGSTGEERVNATRNRRAADRSIDTWARANAADLRRLAGQITALTDLPAVAGTAVGDLDTALAADDAAGLLTPLAAALPHLQTGHPDLATRIDAVTQHTDHIRDSRGGAAPAP